MNLAIDIGNSRTKAYWFEGRNLVNKTTYDQPLSADLINTIQKHGEFSRSIIASTRILSTEVKGAISAMNNVIVLNASVVLPIRFSYRSPETLGADRIAMAVAARMQFPEQNCLVIGAGTCITYDLINTNGEFLGGAISPGLNMRLKAMHEFTERLPLVDLNEEFIQLGDNTSSSLRMGGQTAAVLEMNAMISKFGSQFDNLKVILTGGDAPYFEQHLENRIFAAPNFLGEGLNEILLWINTPE